MKTWMAWLEALIRRYHGHVRDLAIAAGIAENKISRWRYGAYLPAPADQIKLAKVSGDALDTIRQMVWDADHERDQDRESRRRGDTNLAPTKPLAKAQPHRRLMRGLAPALTG